MADAAAKRELRRRRILENSESRLQRITGRVKENSTEEKSNNIVNSRIRSENGFLNTNNSFIRESEMILEEKHKDFLKRDNSSDFQDLELTESDVLYPQQNNHFATTTNHSNLRYTSKDDKKDCELNLNPKTTPANQAAIEQQHSLLYKLFFSPLASVFLAAFVNILILANVDFTQYKGILTPYFVMAITRLCLGNKSEESQGSNMLMAALILCNIKPEVVRILKKILSFYSTTVKDFAVYLTSFVLIHWIISIFRADLSILQFF